MPLKRRSPHPAASAQVGRSLIPAREIDADLGPQGPGAVPPGCTLRFFRYHGSNPSPPSRSWPPNRRPATALLPPAAGHTPPLETTVVASPATAGSRLIGRMGDSKLAVIKLAVIGTPFSLRWCCYGLPERRKSRLRGRGSERVAQLRRSSGHPWRHASNRGPQGRDSRSSGQQTKASGRFAQAPHAPMSAIALETGTNRGGALPHTGGSSMQPRHSPSPSTGSENGAGP